MRGWGSFWRVRPSYRSWLITHQSLIVLRLNRLSIFTSFDGFLWGNYFIWFLCALFEMKELHVEISLQWAEWSVNLWHQRFKPTADGMSVHIQMCGWCMFLICQELKGGMRTETDQAKNNNLTHLKMSWGLFFYLFYAWNFIIRSHILGFILHRWSHMLLPLLQISFTTGRKQAGCYTEPCKLTQAIQYTQMGPAGRATGFVLSCVVSRQNKQKSREHKYRL